MCSVSDTLVYTLLYKLYGKPLLVRIAPGTATGEHSHQNQAWGVNMGGYYAFRFSDPSSILGSDYVARSPLPVFARPCLFICDMPISPFTTAVSGVFYQMHSFFFFHPTLFCRPYFSLFPITGDHSK